MLFTSFWRSERFRFLTCWQHLDRRDCGNFFPCEIPHFLIFRRCETGSEKRSLEGLLKMSSPYHPMFFRCGEDVKPLTFLCFSDVEKMSNPLASYVFQMWRRCLTPYHPMFFRCGEDVKPLTILCFSDVEKMSNPLPSYVFQMWRTSWEKMLRIWRKNWHFLYFQICLKDLVSQNLKQLL